MSQWHCDADGHRLAGETDSCAERFPFTCAIRVIADDDGEEALMKYLYVESMAPAEKFGITVLTELAQLKALSAEEAAGANDPEMEENDLFMECVNEPMKEPGNDWGTRANEPSRDSLWNGFLIVVLLAVNALYGWHHDFEYKLSAMGVSASGETTQSGPEE